MNITDNDPLTEEKTIPALPHPRRAVRRWSYEAKRRIVEETMQPGASVSIVARRHDINSNLLFSWRKLYREGQLGEDAGDQSFIQIGVVGTGASMPGVDRSAGLIELDLPGGVRLRIDSRIEEPVLQRVLRAVKSCT